MNFFKVENLNLTISSHTWFVELVGNFSHFSLSMFSLFIVVFTIFARGELCFPLTSLLFSIQLVTFFKKDPKTYLIKYFSLKGGGGGNVIQSKMLKGSFGGKNFTTLNFCKKNECLEASIPMYKMI